VIDGATHAVGSIGVGQNPEAVAVDPLRNKIYVTNYSNDSVAVIDGATNHVTATVTVGAAAFGADAIAVDPLQNTIYVTTSIANSVAVIDGATNQVTATLGVGSIPVSVAVDPLRNTIYVANVLDNTVSVINLDDVDQSGAGRRGERFRQHRLGP
jgi:YVTN family beta-propeller protein